MFFLNPLLLILHLLVALVHRELVLLLCQNLIMHLDGVDWDRTLLGWLARALPVLDFHPRR